MKKILIVSSFPPCNKTAGQSYTLRLIEDLCKNNTVSLIYFTYPQHRFDFEHPNLIVKRKVKNNSFSKLLGTLKLLFIFPFFTSRFSIRILFYLLANHKKYDCLYFDFSQVSIYSIFISHPFKVIMCHDIIVQRYSRMNFKFKKIIMFFCKWSEKMILSCHNNLFVFSEKDRMLLNTNYELDANVVSFYIDKNIYELKEDDFNFKSDFVFFGAWNRLENSEGLFWFLKEVLGSDLSLQSYSISILGSGLSKDLLQIISKFDNVTALGYVENPYGIISGCRCLLAPIFTGAGVKVKVLESVFCGTQVLGTDVAFEGIGKELLTKCFIFKNKQDFGSEMKSIVKSSYSAKSKYLDHLSAVKVYPNKKFTNFLDS